MYCVIGKKLAHTLSPEIHRAYFELSGRKGEYTAVELTEEEIARGREFLLGYDGVNVTIPYKQAVMPLLDGISDEGARDRRGQHDQARGRQAVWLQHRPVRL